METVITMMWEGFKPGSRGETSLLSQSLLRFKFMYGDKHQIVLKLERPFPYYANTPYKCITLKIWIYISPW